MPEREISPLVASFRAGSGLSQRNQSELNEFPSPSERQSSAPTLTPTPNRETELRSSSFSSPLLEGLSADRATNGAANGAIESSSQST